LLSNQEDINKIKELFRISDIISKGASSFLAEEYKFLSYFMVVFGIIIFICVDVYGN